MTQAVDQKYAGFRTEVRSFLEENLTPLMQQAGRLQTSAFPDIEHAIKWQRVRNARGWGAPSWPKEYGGTGWDFAQQQIFREESLRAGAPGEHQQSLNMCGPCLIGHGSKAQKDYYLPKILNGEHIWCQGYSEPGAGSDLAALTTSALPDGSDYIVNGAKIWTSNAHEATHMFCLVRTSAHDRPQKGITFLLIDMKSAGITVKPILNLNGKHEQNHVYFDNVRVSKKNRVGAEGEGWSVAKHLLEFERGAMNMAPELHQNLSATRNHDASLVGDPDYERRYAEKEISVLAAEATEKRILSALQNGERPGMLASFINVVTMELLQEIDELDIESLGIYALPSQPEALITGNNQEAIGPASGMTSVPRYLDHRAATVAGGSSEVQRNIIAKAVLGL